MSKILLNQEISVVYRPNEDKWFLSGYLGNNFGAALKNLKVYDELDAVTYESNLNIAKTLTFDDKWFYIVYTILEYLKDNCMSRKGLVGSRINLRGIKGAISDLEKERAKIKEYRTHYNFDKDRLKVFTYKPLEYQDNLFNNYVSFKKKTGYRGTLIDAATGTGKTYMGLCLAELLDNKLTIIICPNPTVDKVWGDSISKELFKQPREYFDIRKKESYKNQKYIVANYEAIDKIKYILSKLDNTSITFIIDESHNFADTKSKRTNELLELINTTNSNDVILLSGTPIKAYTSEMINILRLLDGRIDSKNDVKILEMIFKSPKAIFKDMLPKLYQESSFKIEKKEIELEPITKIYLDIELNNGSEYTLSNILKKFRNMYEKRLKEILESLDKYEEIFNLGLSQVKNQALAKAYIKQVEIIKDLVKFGEHMKYPDTLAEAKKMERMLIVEMKPEIRKIWLEAAVCIKYPKLKVIGECLAKVVGQARIDCHRDIAKELNYIDIINSSEKDTIIFSNYVEVCEQVMKSTKELGYKPIGVYGENVKNLNKSVEQFKNNENINPLVTTYKSLSTGVPLTNANIIILIDLPFRMYTYNQAVSRAWRLGQDSPVIVYIPNLKTGEEPNINQRNFDIITYFKKEVENITGLLMDVDITESKIAMTANFEEFKEPLISIDNKTLEIKQNKNTLSGFYLSYLN